MTDEEFAAGVDAILLTGIRGHTVHRALDLWWMRYASEHGGVLADATAKWMAAIEQDHDAANPYPLGAKRWWQFWKPAPPRPPRSPEDNEYLNWSCP